MIPRLPQHAGRHPSRQRRRPGNRKDIVQVHPGETVRVIGRFEGFSGRYPVHCHILDHEDCEMIRFFNVA